MKSKKMFTTVIVAMISGTILAYILREMQVPYSTGIGIFVGVLFGSLAGWLVTRPSNKQ